MSDSFSQIHHSDFGGLWTDRIDAVNEVSNRLQTGQINQDQEYLLRNWMRDGYVILEGAVSPQLCAQLAQELETIFKNGSDSVLFQDPEAPPGVANTVPPGLPPERMRLVDMYGASKVAADILMAPAVRDFLKLIFESAPLCFQGLTFEQGSGQGLHQDTAYVVIDKPLELAAAWVALEDVQEGSGELMYVNGSHRIPEWKFGGDSKHWNPDVHGHESHTEWSKWLIRIAEEMGLEKKIFRPKRGDVLIWSADLVHGGSPVGDKSLSRRSLVGHYCPVNRSPHYFSYLPQRAVRAPYKGGYFSSSYYAFDETTFAEVQQQKVRRRLFFFKS
jgi:hypothetical protein